MLTATSVQTQLGAVRADRLRVLVVGAGVAGVTLAQLLRQEGLHPVLLERSGQHADSGYMLALMPMVDPVLEDLGLREEYRARSVGLQLARLVLHRSEALAALRDTATRFVSIERVLRPIRTLLEDTPRVPSSPAHCSHDEPDRGIAPR